MICIKCGRSLPESSNYCDSCGTKTDRDIPFTHMDSHSRYIQINDCGVLDVRLDKRARACLMSELKIGIMRRFFHPFKTIDSVRHEFYRLASVSPDILANMCMGKFIPEADIIKVRILFYPGDPEYTALYARNYLDILTSDGDRLLQLPYRKKLEYRDFAPFMRFFALKGRGMVLIKEPLDENIRSMIWE